MSNNKKIALVTGGSRGIGLGIVSKLIEEGFDVAVNGIREEGAVLDTLESLRKGGTNVIYCQGNIALKSDRDSMLEKTVTQLGPINVLVNNAGVAPKVRADLLEVTEEDYDYVMSVNARGTFFMSQAVALQMIQCKTTNTSFKGSIINISSVSAEVASLNRGAYCMSKAGVSMLTKLLAVRMAEAGIPVYEVRPGIIKTDLTAKVQAAYLERINNGLTLDKRLGEPADIGTIVAAMATGKLPYSTGQFINADGGMSVWRL